MLYCNLYTTANWISQTIFINIYATEGKLSTQQTSTVAYTCQKEGENSQVNKYNDLHVKKKREKGQVNQTGCKLTIILVGQPIHILLCI